MADMDTPEAIDRMTELGMLAGQDVAKAKADAGLLTLPVVGLSPELVRGLVHERITDIVATFDNHDPGLVHPSPVGRPRAGDPVYVCPNNCGFRGTQAEWERHLADKLADALTQAGM